MGTHTRTDRTCTTDKLNTSNQRRNLDSSMRHSTTRTDSSRTRNQALPSSNMCQLALSLLPINNISTHHSSNKCSSRSINLMAHRRRLSQRDRHRTSVKVQEHRAPNPASIILLTRSWRIAVTTFGLMLIFNRPRFTRSRKMCLRNVLSGFLSCNVMARHSSTSRTSKSGESLVTSRGSCESIRTQLLRLRRQQAQLLSPQTVIPMRTVAHSRRTQLSMAKSTLQLQLQMQMLLG